MIFCLKALKGLPLKLLLHAKADLGSAFIRFAEESGDWKVCEDVLDYFDLASGAKHNLTELGVLFRLLASNNPLQAKACEVFFQYMYTPTVTVEKKPKIKPYNESSDVHGMTGVLYLDSVQAYERTHDIQLRAPYPFDKPDLYLIQGPLDNPENVHFAIIQCLLSVMEPRYFKKQESSFSSELELSDQAGLFGELKARNPCLSDPEFIGKHLRFLLQNSRNPERIFEFLTCDIEVTDDMLPMAFMPMHMGRRLRALRGICFVVLQSFWRWLKSFAICAIDVLGMSLLWQTGDFLQIRTKTPNL